MIEFNLLPAVKQEYIKVQRSKRMVITIALIVGAIAIAIFVVLFVNVNILQKKAHE